jgi:purine-binding chemotaxis protein CheW
VGAGTEEAGLLVTEFRMGESSFGVDARVVLEVVKMGEITRVHGAPSAVIGIRNLRGRIVTLVDLAEHIGVGSVAPGPENRVLILEDRGEPYGFLVDSVSGAIALDREGLEAPPASLDTALSGRLLGIWREADHLTAILDPASLFTWDESAQKA